MRVQSPSADHMMHTFHFAIRLGSAIPTTILWLLLALLLGSPQIAACRQLGNAQQNATTASYSSVWAAAQRYVYLLKDHSVEQVACVIRSQYKHQLCIGGPICCKVRLCVLDPWRRAAHTHTPSMLHRSEMWTMRQMLSGDLKGRVVFWTNNPGLSDLVKIFTNPKSQGTMFIPGPKEAYSAEAAALCLTVEEHFDLFVQYPDMATAYLQSWYVPGPSLKSSDFKDGMVLTTNHHPGAGRPPLNLTLSKQVM